MTNEEAIKKITHVKYCYAYEGDYEAFDMAIEALSADRPTEKQPITCDGCKYVGTYDRNFPCSSCIRREKDYYVPEE